MSFLRIADAFLKKYQEHFLEESLVKLLEISMEKFQEYNAEGILGEIRGWISD